MRSTPFFAVWLAGSLAAAGPYKNLYVFGDSLSDVGNVSAATFGLQPGGGYFNGRFSNGPVYAERLAEGLGLAPLTRSGAGGTDYAFGGAETDGPNGFFNGGFLIDSLVEQVDAFLGSLDGASADSDALYAVFIGANDLLNGTTNAVAPAGVVSQQISRLVDSGARHFLGINLPRLGLTPDNLGNASLTATTIAYNQALDGVYDAITDANAETTIHRLDVETLFDALIDDPAAWGFTNVTGQGIDAADASGYVFWDGVHPTREAHALLGEAAIRAVLPAGDYDRDGFVTTADVAVWNAEYGGRFDAAAGVTLGIAADANGDGRVDAADYTASRDGVLAAGMVVPEPATIALAAVVIAAGCRHRA